MISRLIKSLISTAILLLVVLLSFLSGGIFQYSKDYKTLEIATVENWKNNSQENQVAYNKIIDLCVLKKETSWLDTARGYLRPPYPPTSSELFEECVREKGKQGIYKQLISVKTSLYAPWGVSNVVIGSYLHLDLNKKSLL